MERCWERRETGADAWRTDKWAVCSAVMAAVEYSFCELAREGRQGLKELVVEGSTAGPNLGRPCCRSSLGGAGRFSRPQQLLALPISSTTSDRLDRIAEERTRVPLKGTAPTRPSTPSREGHRRLSTATPLAASRASSRRPSTFTKAAHNEMLPFHTYLLRSHFVQTNWDEDAFFSSLTRPTGGTSRT